MNKLIVTKIKSGHYAVTRLDDGAKFQIHRMPSTYRGLPWVLENEAFEVLGERTLEAALANIRCRWSRITGHTPTKEVTE